MLPVNVAPLPFPRPDAPWDCVAGLTEIQLHTPRAARVQLQRPPELPLRSGEIPVEMQFCQRQCCVSSSEAGILLYCHCGRFLNLAPALARRKLAEKGQESIRLGHVSICGRIIRVELDSLVVILNALLQIEII